ncbi:tetratricopeptide repeat protein 31-like isoform X2 [Poeciliopsis prolifica]|uniref:tetratricopeptide repeat protein 31-like isoform X2 n=1 Tax=Poeciliopsis prolifica TaxID=188132 RepID=UPI002413AB60|nr:tetratricopeptide repeat protein 31-like isoform X2 [Poeciliopsis prolifica]
MQVFNDETEFTDIHMIQKVVGLFGHQPQMQRIITCGLLGIEYDAELDVDDYDSWTHRRHSFNQHLGHNTSSGNRTGASSSIYQSPLHYYSSVRGKSSSPSYKVQTKESDSERKARLLQETKKSREKAERKRLKKQKQKQRKQMEKVKQNPGKPQEGDAAEESEESKSVNHDEKKKNLAAAKDTDSSSSSGQESSDDDEDGQNDSHNFEELDMTSSFVTKAALIAQRKLEQKPKSDKKEKRKTPEKKSKSVPVKTSEDKEDVKGPQQKDSVVPSAPSIEDNIKISTDLAIIGNKFASTGDYSMAVKYFTDAIKYNPKEFKLFGNRSFCFEKMQEYEKALTDAELALSVSPGWVKGLFRKGKALAGLKRYKEAADAFRDVLKRESSYAEAAQELMRVQIIQLMAYGFTREQSSNALIIHGSVDKALEVLLKLHRPPGAVSNGSLPPAQLANVTGVSPVLSANSSPAPVASTQSHDATKKPLLDKPLGLVQNLPNVDNQSKPAYNQAGTINSDRTPPELFPVWVGNLCFPVTEAMISKLFSKAGPVFSVKLLTVKRCAFVNFTKQEHCDEAIRRLHGYDLHGIKIAVRYPDRIPPGMGISRSALRARDLHDENLRQCNDEKKAVGNQRCFRDHNPDPGTL